MVEQKMAIIKTAENKPPQNQAVVFSDFFYMLRAYGLKIALNEWSVLLQGLQLGLHDSSLTGFYYLARAVLVKTEADFDRFDLAFLEYFEGIVNYAELPQEFLDWLAEAKKQHEFDKEKVDRLAMQRDLEELRRMFEERLKEQKERHDGGSKWIGTGGSSPFGHSGYNPRGIRVGGKGGNFSALQVASKREFADFREDTVLEIRQFQMAFRRLRQFSTQEDGPKDELQLDDTIKKTSDNAGHLNLVFDRPRRNSVKLLLLFDSGGSMWSHTHLCNLLFQAAIKSKYFKDLKVYYFHNCPYDELFLTPACSHQSSVKSEWVMNNLKGDYKVIVIGDAAMADYELLEPGYTIDYYHKHTETGVEWIRRFGERYQKMIWLNPIPERLWERGFGHETIGIIRQLVPMYPLTVKGLESGLKLLMAAR